MLPVTLIVFSELERARADINSVQRAGGESSPVRPDSGNALTLALLLLSSLTTCSYNKHPEPATSSGDFS